MTITAHPAAGTYSPVNLVVLGAPIHAEVDVRGRYTVYAGPIAIACGELDGTEGDLMVFFEAEALVWGADIDADLIERAAADMAEAMAHMDAAELDGEIEGEAVVAAVLALSDDYQVMQRDHSWTPVASGRVARKVRAAVSAGLAVRAERNEDGNWRIEISDGKGSAYARYVHRTA